MVSIAKQDRWTENIPTDWALCEVVLREFRGRDKRMIPVEDFSKTCFGKNKEKYEQISDILRFYHEIGVILHFDETSLTDTIIIDIQWFVDSFKNIITDPNHVRDIIGKKMDWLNFSNNGHIPDSLLNKIWKSKGFEINRSNKKNLLQYMERLGLISTGRKVHYIPCMNTMTFTEVQQKDLKSIESKTSVLVFRFTFLPYFIYFRLVVACLTQTDGTWRFPKDKHLCLYKNTAYFMHSDHRVVLSVNRYAIQLQVFRRDGEISKIVTLNIRDVIEKLLNTLTSNFHKTVVYTIGYQCSNHEVFHDHDDCFVEEEQINLRKKQTCPIHETESYHMLRIPYILYYWNKVLCFLITF
jgi:hypothetical protein